MTQLRTAHLSLGRFLLVVLACALGQGAFAQASVTLNFVNADIDQVAKAIGAATGKTILVDPRVKGQINLVSEQPVDRDIAFKSLEASLRMQGFAMIDDHGILKVVPEADAKLQGVPTAAGSQTPFRGDMIVTQVFKLKNESANNLLPVLRPLIAPNNTITAYPANNSLVVTDYADNVRRIATIIASIDDAGSASIDVVPVRNANAGDLATLLQKMLDPNATGSNDPTLRVAVTPDPRTNAIMLRTSNAARMQLARSLVAKLDEPGTGSTGNMHVIRLHNADAVRLAQTLRGMLGGGQGATGRSEGSSGASLFNSSGATPGAASSANSTGAAGLPPLPTSSGLGGSGGSAAGQGALGSASPNFTNAETDASANAAGGIVQADAPTNSLIITASEPVFRNIQAVVDELDARRAQVYIESLIIEVSDDKESQLGVQWQGLTSNGSNTTGVYAGTNFGSAGGNIIDLTAGAYAAKSNPSNIVLPNEGLNIGILHRFNNLLGIGGLLQALETLTGVNVLSTPNLMTLDNEEAKIVIGQNVPFITGSYAQTGTTATVTPFQTFERQDVGITLTVKPQITDGGTVRLQIYQESSSVVAGTQANPGGVTTNKRSIQSTVLCDNGQIIVLGGLIQDQYNESNNKVPFLGDIPYVGALFRSESLSHTRTNLMVFLRPVLVRDATTSAEISQNRYDLMRGLGQNYQPDNFMLRGPTPVAPALSASPRGGPVPEQFLDPAIRQPVTTPLVAPGDLPARSSP